MRKRFLAEVTALALLCLSSGHVHAAEDRSPAIVREVIDGDTFELDTGERVRLIGIDAPEYHPQDRSNEFYGQEASDQTRRKLLGKTVFLETDTEPTDRYGRKLAYVYLADGEFVNEALVREGYAKTAYFAPNGRHYRLLKDTETEAKRLRKGLWA